MPAPASAPSATPEFDLLCACCCENGHNAIAAALDSKVNWERIFTLASHHRLLPCLYFALRETSAVPVSIQMALEARFHSCISRVLRFSAELVAILRGFSACGIEAILHKGPALAQHLYCDSCMREFGDLDFLIRASDAARARGVLNELGFRPHLQLSARQERGYLRTGYEYAFDSALGTNVVELQWQIVPRFYAVEFQPEALFSRSVKIEFEGEHIRMLCDEDLLLTLCVHAAKHCWPQLGMIRDITTLAARPLDWPWIIAEARRMGILRIVTVSLMLARKLVGTAIPRDLATDADFGECEPIVAIAEHNLRDSVEADTESLDYFRLMMRMREKWQDRARFAARLAFTPSVNEWNAIRLPDFLFPLYRGVRALRLLKRVI